jgi:ABC-type glycerol-3-phosphate transport system substrate-binding protein
MLIARLRSALGLLLVAGVAMSAAACGDSDTPAASKDGKVTQVINGLPPATEKATHARFLANVAEFEKTNPNIKIDAREGKMDPQTFPAKLAGGQLEDVFYVYFTDPASLIAKRQVSDISKYLQDYPIASQLKPEVLRVFQDDKGATYGLPYKNYSMGLLYNRELFTKAGLDPNSPPKTWADVRAAAKKITVQTGLSAGTYCDVVHGKKSGGSCTGPTVKVKDNGKATLTIGATGAVAIRANARL